MVRADASSTFTGTDAYKVMDIEEMYGGIACGYVINIPNIDVCFYYAGCTNLFSDMKLICDLYKPNVAFIPVGD